MSNLSLTPVQSVWVLHHVLYWITCCTVSRVHFILAKTLITCSGTHTQPTKTIQVAKYKVHCIVPRCSVTFWTHPKILPVGQFFRRWILRSRFFRLIDWRWVNFDLIGLLDSYRTTYFHGKGGGMFQWLLGAKTNSGSKNRFSHSSWFLAWDFIAKNLFLFIYFIV